MATATLDATTLYLAEQVAYDVPDPSRLGGFESFLLGPGEPVEPVLAAPFVVPRWSKAPGCMYGRGRLVRTRHGHEVFLADFYLADEPPADL